MKLSEELKLRGVEVGDIYAYNRNGNPFQYAHRVHNSEYIEELVSARHDEETTFLWLVGMDGNKKEIIK